MDDTKLLTKTDILSYHRKMLANFEQQLQALKTDALNPANTATIHEILRFALSEEEAELFRVTQRKAQEATHFIQQYINESRTIPTTSGTNNLQKRVNALEKRTQVQAKYAGDITLLVKLVERAKRALERRIATEEVTLKNLSKN